MTNPKIPTSPPPSKTAGSNEKKALALKPMNTKKSYTEASKTNNSSNIKDVIRVKEAFPELSANEVGKMLKAKNSNGGMKKPKINMTTKGQSRREIIIPMAKTNAELIINSAHIHISNVNKCLKNSKSNIFADFIRFNVNGIIITTNKPVRRGSHRGESPQNGLGDEQTYGTTLASAYVLCRLSAAWSQLQMKEKKSEWK